MLSLDFKCLPLIALLDISGLVRSQAFFLGSLAAGACAKIHNKVLLSFI